MRFQWLNTYSMPGQVCRVSGTCAYIGTVASSKVQRLVGVLFENNAHVMAVLCIKSAPFSHSSTLYHSALVAQSFRPHLMSLLSSVFVLGGFGLHANGWNGKSPNVYM